MEYSNTASLLTETEKIPTSTEALFMAKYHISADGNPRVCTAAEGNCPIGGDETHYTSKNAARAAFEAAVVIIGSTSEKKISFGKSVRTVNSKGDFEWRNPNGKLHRDGDLPAVERADGSKLWYRNGKRHRDGDLPAVEHQDGSKGWFRNGQIHRDGDQPAIEAANGTKEWWINGIFQYLISSDGTRINALKPS